jgi:enamine deaminase RidA (YjgF/YER057c/UK114 family)
LVALAAVGAGPDHVVKAVIYVVTAEQPVLAEAWRQFHTTDLAPAFSTASTLIGLAQLGFPGQLVELDLIASIPD